MHNFENIPLEMKKAPQWVARVGKVPINPHNLRGASANNKNTWGTFEQAYNSIGKQAGSPESVKEKKCDGIGFEICPPFCGIDIDHCFNPSTGELTKEAADIINFIDSYTEFSPSGTGIHIICKLDKPLDLKRNKRKLDDVQALEIYENNRYFTVTGNVFGEPKPIKIRTSAAKCVHQAYLCDTNEPTNHTKSDCKPLQPLNFTDDEILRVALNSRNGAEFNALWNGDTSRYSGDESRADLALCNMLAFYCQGDKGAVDRLFRQSALMRPKWNEKRGDNTYGEMTIEKAVNSCREFYSPHRLSATTDEPRAEKKNKSRLLDFDYETVKHYKADDIGTAEFFSTLVKDFMCYVPEEKAFYIYNGVIWEKDVVKENLVAGKMLMEFVATVQKLIPPKPVGKPNEWTDEETEQENINGAFRSQYKSLGNANGRERVMKDIKKLLHKSRTAFDRQPELLNCKNCTYNLITGKKQPHNAADLLTKCVNADYDENAHNERFERFIDEICEGDEERKTALQTALGYSLIGATPEECFFIAYGKSTRNGKGTLFDLVLDTIGDYGLQMDFETIARTGTKDGSRATPDLARLIGVRYVLVNEPQKGTCFNEALVKQLTGSDDINARPLFGAIIQFKPLFTIFITTNNLPAIADDTLFSSDRIRILPFEKHFDKSERNTNLKAELREDNGREAVLKWLIDGYRLYRTNGLTDSKRGNEILRQYRKDNDYIQQFIDECLEVLDWNDRHVKKIPLTEIQQEYNEWCRIANVKPIGKTRLREDLINHGLVVDKYGNQFSAAARIKDNRTVDVYQ